jgi:predicted amidohydrolase YtcJ
MPAASELLVIGLVHTLDPLNPLAEAVLVRDGRIACAGTLARCEAQAGASARRVRVGSAVPGLADAHGHVLGLGRARGEVSCAGAASEAACAARAAARARELPPGAWLRGRGWDQNRWPGGAFPTAAALTRAVPDRPAVLVRVDGHASWANAPALAAAGIAAGTPDPQGGRILRLPDGSPSGVLVDAAQDLVLRRMPAPGPAEIEAFLLAGLRELAAAGLTAVHDAGVPPDVLDVYLRLAREDRLPIRVHAMLDGEPPLAALEAELARVAALGRAAGSAPPGVEVGLLTVRSVKLFADGALGSRGAALFEDYADDPGNRGLLLSPPEVLRAKVRAVVAAGFQPAVHAIGDRAVAEVLAAFEAAGEPARVRAARPRIEHLQILRSADAPRLVATGAVGSMQPTHATSDAAWAPARLGPGSARLRGAYAWRTVLSAGAPLAFGSDFPIEEPDPRAGLASAETRVPPGGGKAFLPEERLGRTEALRAFTSGPAFAAFAEARRGMIREGLDADLTCFAGDVLSVPAAALAALPISLVVVAGRIVVGGEPSPSPPSPGPD